MPDIEAEQAEQRKTVQAYIDTRERENILMGQARDVAYSASCRDALERFGPVQFSEWGRQPLPESEPCPPAGKMASGRNIYVQKYIDGLEANGTSFTDACKMALEKYGEERYNRWCYVTPAEAMST